MTLSERQREVLALLADGCSYQEIGVRLSLTPDTVKNHLQAAYHKLGARSGAHAVALAIRTELIK